VFLIAPLPTGRLAFLPEEIISSKDMSILDCGSDVPILNTACPSAMITSFEILATVLLTETAQKKDLKYERYPP